MNCPHCGTSFHPQFKEYGLDFNPFRLVVYYQVCPACGKHIVEIFGVDINNHSKILISRVMIFPRISTSRPMPPDLPEPYAQDFLEAVQILSISPKASAALSRRIIQALLREKAGTKSRDLRDQIDEVLGANGLPSYIADDLHAVRNIGNFGAHETRDKLSGAILDVQPAEAEWTLKVAEAMLDFYFVEPAKAVARRAELNEKLEAAGKPKIAETPVSSTKLP